MNQISWKRCGEIATGKPVRAAPLCGGKVPFNRAEANESNGRQIIRLLGGENRGWGIGDGVKVKSEKWKV